MILSHLLLENQRHWSAIYSAITPHLQTLATGLQAAYRKKAAQNSNQLELETARNKVREELCLAYGEELFPLGTTGTGMSDLAFKMFKSTNSQCTGTQSCKTCKITGVLSQPDIILAIPSFTKFPTINKWFENYQKNSNKKCGVCHSQLETIRDMSKSYNLFAIYCSATLKITINKSLRILKPGTNNATLTPLRGIVYWGANHFVARIVDKDKNVWYYDGIATGRKSRYEDKLSAFTDAQLSAHLDDHNVLRKAVLIIYAKK